MHLQDENHRIIAWFGLAPTHLCVSTVSFTKTRSAIPPALCFRCPFYVLVKRIENRYRSDLEAANKPKAQAGRSSEAETEQKEEDPSETKDKEEKRGAAAHPAVPVVFCGAQVPLQEVVLGRDQHVTGHAVSGLDLLEEVLLANACRNGEILGRSWGKRGILPNLLEVCLLSIP